MSEANRAAGARVRNPCDTGLELEVWLNVMESRKLAMNQQDTPALRAQAQNSVRDSVKRKAVEKGSKENMNSVPDHLVSLRTRYGASYTCMPMPWPVRCDSPGD